MRFDELQSGDILSWGDPEDPQDDWWLFLYSVASAKSYMIVLHGYSFQTRQRDVIMRGYPADTLSYNVYRDGVLINSDL